MTTGRSARLRTLLLVTPFALGPLLPTLAQVALVPLGLYAILTARRLPRFAVAFLLFGLLGATAHLVAVGTGSATGSTAVVPPSGVTVGEPDGTNLLDAEFHRSLQGHSWGMYEVARGSRDPADGMWRVPRREPLGGRLVDHIRGGSRISLDAGTPYTISFYVRSGPPPGAYDIAVRMARERISLTPRYVPVGEDLMRAWATFTPAENVDLVHAFEIGRFRGDWSSIEIGYVQLEKGTEPSTYRPPLDRRPAWAALRPLRGVVWWLGTALVAVATLAGLGFLIRRTPRPSIAGALVLGLVAHLVASLVLQWGDRGAGFATHPNVLGHAALLNALAIAGLGSAPVTAIGVIVSGLVIASTGSRTAFVFWLSSVVALVAGRGSRRAAAWALVAVAAIVVASVGLFGSDRLLTSLDLEGANVQRRVAIWQVGAAAFRDHALVGVGQGRFGDYLALNRPYGSPVPQATHAHNALVHLAAESGLAGLAGLGLVVASVLVFAIRRRCWIAVGTVGVVGGLNMLDFTLFTPLVAFPLLLVFAVCATAAEAAEPDGGPHHGSRAPSESRSSRRALLGAVPERSDRS